MILVGAQRGRAGRARASRSNDIDRLGATAGRCPGRTITGPDGPRPQASRCEPVEPRSAPPWCDHPCRVEPGRSSPGRAAEPSRAQPPTRPDANMPIRECHSRTGLSARSIRVSIKFCCRNAGGSFSRWSPPGAGTSPTSSPTGSNSAQTSSACSGKARPGPLSMSCQAVAGRRPHRHRTGNRSAQELRSVFHGWAVR